MFEPIAMLILMVWPVGLFVCCIVLLLYAMGGTIRNLFEIKT